MRVSVLVVCALCLVGAVGLSGGAVSAAEAAVGAGAITADSRPSADAIDANETPTAAAADGRILELYPNPVAARDRGEYAVVSLPVAGTWEFSDGKRPVTFVVDEPGVVAISDDPERATAHTDALVVEVPPRFALADAGETLELRYDDRTVDTVRYERAPEGERWLRDADPHWRPYGFEPRAKATVDATTATAFVLPDGVDAPLDPFEAAEDRILLGAYTFESWRVADALVAAEARGVEVRLLVEGGPVGGVSRTQAAVLDYLSTAGIDVRVMTGEWTRFSYHHAKYAVADDIAVVVSENWKPSGTGGASNRGWGVRIDGREAAAELTAVFEHDATWRDSVGWDEFAATATFHGDGVRERGATADDIGSGMSARSYPAEHPPETVAVERVAVLTAPGNAEDAVVDRIDGANRTVSIIQPRVSGREQPMMAAAIRAAQRGVRVRVLLSSYWYDRDDNEAFAARTNRYAERTALPLEVRLAEPGGRYEKIHAKGVVVDDAAIVGSLNWNNHSARQNREVAVVLDGPEAAAYYRSVFDEDWEGRPATERLTIGALVALGGAVAGGVAIGRKRISFA
ncbi:phospholipase D-like domain-containing protein [Haloferacaceae archaeon DSL9]